MGSEAARPDMGGNIMAGRRPGPAQNPQHRHRGADPILAKDGWTEIDPAAFAGSIPPIPDWVNCSVLAAEVYAELARLPQAATWGPGTWLELHLTLPLLDRYLSRPGSEAFKAIIQTLGAGLSLTELDMSRARMRLRVDEVEQDGTSQTAVEAAGAVSSLAERRKRVTNAS